MEAVTVAENKDSAASPTSVLEDEEICEVMAGAAVEKSALSNCMGGSVVSGTHSSKGQKFCTDKCYTGTFDDDSNVFSFDATQEDSSFVSRAMAEEEEKMQETWVKNDSGIYSTKESSAALDESQFNKLDELLTQTQLYSQFLLEKMDNITYNVQDNGQNGSSKGKRTGGKRKSNGQRNTKKAKTALVAMLARSQENTNVEDPDLTEEERIEKEQVELVPLLSGGKLKQYQLKGVKWLISLWQNGLNGILADQMGLGKTVQTIGFLAHLKGNGLDGPFLIIAPLSTLSNWMQEFSRFVPSINAIIYHGDKKERADIRRKCMSKTVGPDFPIVITSYAVALNDAKKLGHYSWKYVVVDEGHRLKNTHCKLLRELRRIPMENKLLLTGTPLQNNLAELWSLLNFILPDIFSSHEEFESWFDLSGKCSNEVQQEEFEKKRRVQVVSKLHSILRPFLLRRMKEDVEHMLPKKKEIILYANMTDHQRRLQDHLVNRTLEKHIIEKADYAIGRPGIKGKLNNLIVQLRKNCNHPDLLESTFDSSDTYPPVELLLEQCGKFRLLDRLLVQLLSQKHKVLIFSQWTKVLDIIEYYCSEKGFKVCRIDGSVLLEERKRQILEFNDIYSNVRIFLLSTRAGGLGINLTAADTCILYDSDWNPQMDLQAMDRCHRIGQTQPVHVYRLVTSHSVEGRILKKAFGKLRLEHLVIDKGQFQQERYKPNTLEETELLALLKDSEDDEDKKIQTDISDTDLEIVMDRSDMTLVFGKGNNVTVTGNDLPLKGPGWEVVMPPKTGTGMLSSVMS